MSPHTIGDNREQPLSDELRGIGRSDVGDTIFVMLAITTDIRQNASIDPIVATLPLSRFIVTQRFLSQGRN
jgi:hypothetical protein